MTEDEFWGVQKGKSIDEQIKEKEEVKKNALIAIRELKEQQKNEEAQKEKAIKYYLGCVVSDFLGRNPKVDDVENLYYFLYGQEHNKRSDKTAGHFFTDFMNSEFYRKSTMDKESYKNVPKFISPREKEQKKKMEEQEQGKKKKATRKTTRAKKSGDSNRTSRASAPDNSNRTNGADPNVSDGQVVQNAPPDQNVQPDPMAMNYNDQNNFFPS